MAQRIQSLCFSIKSRLVKSWIFAIYSTWTINYWNI